MPGDWRENKIEYRFSNTEMYQEEKNKNEINFHSQNPGLEERKNDVHSTEWPHSNDTTDKGELLNEQIN